MNHLITELLHPCIQCIRIMESHTVTLNNDLFFFKSVSYMPCMNYTATCPVGHQKSQNSKHGPRSSSPQQPSMQPSVFLGLYIVFSALYHSACIAASSYVQLDDSDDDLLATSLPSPQSPSRTSVLKPSKPKKTLLKSDSSLSIHDTHKSIYTKRTGTASSTDSYGMSPFFFTLPNTMLDASADTIPLLSQSKKTLFLPPSVASWTLKQPSFTPSWQHLYHAMQSFLSLHPTTSPTPPTHLATAGKILGWTLDYGDSDRFCQDHFSALIRQAQDEILIYTFIYAKGSPLALCFEKALHSLSQTLQLEQKGRTVRVRVIINTIGSVAFGAQLPNIKNLVLTKTTARPENYHIPSQLPHVDVRVKTVHELPCGVVHTKAVIVDRTALWFGSKNFDLDPCVRLTLAFSLCFVYIDGIRRNSWC